MGARVGARFWSRITDGGGHCREWEAEGVLIWNLPRSGGIFLGKGPKAQSARSQPPPCLSLAGEHRGTPRGGEHPREAGGPNLRHDGQGETPPVGATDHLRAWLEAGSTPGVTSTGPVGSRPLQTSRVLSKFVQHFLFDQLRFFIYF